MFDVISKHCMSGVLAPRSYLVYKCAWLALPAKKKKKHINPLSSFLRTEM